MPVPIVCLDRCLRQFALIFGRCFSRPQTQHFVIVLTLEPGPSKSPSMRVNVSSSSTVYRAAGRWAM